MKKRTFCQQTAGKNNDPRGLLSPHGLCSVLCRCTYKQKIMYFIQGPNERKKKQLKKWLSRTFFILCFTVSRTRDVLRKARTNLEVNCFIKITLGYLCTFTTLFVRISGLHGGLVSSVWGVCCKFITCALCSQFVSPFSFLSKPPRRMSWDFHL